MPVLPEPRSDQCQAINALLYSDNLYYPLDQPGVAVAGTTNALNARQNEAVTVSLFFCPFSPSLLTPPPLPTGGLYSPQFRSN